MRYQPEVKVVVGINASRARSGGAKAHLIGLLRDGEPTASGIDRIHVWADGDLARLLPERPWLVVHPLASTRRSLLRALAWERFRLAELVGAEGCQLLLNVDAGSVCRFRPCITMSRDMLSFEPGEIWRYGPSRAFLRLAALRYAQVSSLRHADGAIFLTNYASKVIQRSTGRLRSVAIIPHGVGDEFRRPIHAGNKGLQRPIKCLYVSNTAPYKHQWHVVEAIARIRDRGHEVTLTLLGDKRSRSGPKLEKYVSSFDPHSDFVILKGAVPHQELPSHLADADIFVFASSCENMPNSLIEAMAAGLPIACSNRGPMPEVLGEAGIYFNPEDPPSIASAILELINDGALRERLRHEAKARADAHSWARCSAETFGFVADILTSVECRR